MKNQKKAISKSQNLKKSYGGHRKGRKKGSKNYFTSGTENAIVEYNSELNTAVRNIIYRDRIQFAFDKLVENTINNNKFPYIRECYVDIKHEVIVHLLENIEKYSQDKGKAFSYFGKIAKNYLIAWNLEHYKKSKIHNELDVVDYSRNIDKESARSDREEMATNMATYMIDYLENNMYVLFKKQKDLLVIDAVIELLKKRMFIENQNKKVIYVLLKNMTGLKSPHITKILNKLKIIYKKLVKEYHRRGHIDTSKQNKFI